LLGLGAALYWYRNGRPEVGLLPVGLADHPTTRPLYLASLNKFRVDEFYNATVVLIARGLAKLSDIFELVVVEPLTRGIASLPKLLGRLVFAPYQNGLVQSYAAVTALGVAILLLALLLMF